MMEHAGRDATLKGLTNSCHQQAVVARGLQGTSTNTGVQVNTHGTFLH